jgi:hypothetical protein
MLWVRYVQIHCYFFFIAQFIWRPDWKEPYKMLSSLQFGLQSNFIIDYFLKPSRNLASYPIPVNLPPFRGSLPRKSLISRMDWVSCAGDINLPHTPFPPARYPPNKKIKYNKILTYILRSIFLEIPHLELPRWWKTQRDTNVNDIRLLICLTPLQVNWVMEIN